MKRSCPGRVKYDTISSAVNIASVKVTRVGLLTKFPLAKRKISRKKSNLHCFYLKKKR